MGAKKQREYQCSVVNETVKIHLHKKQTAGWKSNGALFAQCNQGECQYVDENKPPCPLSLSLFEEEIRELREIARQRREASDDYY